MTRKSENLRKAWTYHCKETHRVYKHRTGEHTRVTGNKPMAEDVVFVATGSVIQSAKSMPLIFIPMSDN